MPQQFAASLQQVFRSSDYLGRWSGEEFVVVSRFTNRRWAAELAQPLLDTVLEYPFTLSDGTLLSKSCSIGYSCFPLMPEHPQQVSWHQALEAADACLYAAKSSGKRCWIAIEGVQPGYLPSPHRPMGCTSQSRQTDYQGFYRPGTVAIEPGLITE